MTGTAGEVGAPERLGRTLSAPKIVFMVVAAAAPLVAMAGTVPLSMGSGNGAGVPGAYVVAMLTLLCFSVGYAAMARSITDGGGFYGYIARGLGRPVAAGGAVLALTGYNGLVAALGGGIGYFLTEEGGAPGPWWAWSLGAIVLMGAFGYRNVDLSAKILGVLMVCEIGALTAFDVAVLAHKGLDAFQFTSFAPSTVLSGAPGVAFMFAFGSFVGYEAAALFSEETKNPVRTVPRATYAAVLVIGLFYTFTSWLMVGAIGADDAKETAVAQEGDLFFFLTEQQLGETARALFGLLIITSLFASLLAGHQAAGRYVFALARDGLAPAKLAAVHTKHGSPYMSSLAQTGFTIVVVALFAIAGLDPYKTLVTVMSGLSTLGIVLLQTLTSIACVVYFRRTGSGGLLGTLVVPLVGCLGLLFAASLILVNFETLAHTDSPLINALPYAVLACAVAAALYALWLRKSDESRYVRIGAMTRGTDELPAG
ncbi:APC family permease [Actinocorallia sp. B10E7]|uniref:APC family permease n=1 Tax=Actinocorallia sp. B10E7 TaxID=3153558 RepID=UPI00325F196E